MRVGRYWPSLILLLSFMLSNCAAPDPYVTMMNQRYDQIMQMPEGPEKLRALQEGVADIDRERQTRAMESSARALNNMAQPTPYVPSPTPVQVQIVPYP